MDGSKIAYYVHSDKETHIYIATTDGQSKKLTSTPVLATLVTSIEWTPDSKNVLASLIPSGRGPMPVEGKVDTEPDVYMTDRGPTPNRTFRFLMETPHDFEMLEWLVTGQMTKIDVATGTTTKLGKPAMHQTISMSPDRQHVRVTTLQKPFSYRVPVRSFGTLDAIYNLNGAQLAVINKQKLRPSTIQVDGRGGRGGRGETNEKRNVTWRPDGKGLSYLQMEPRKTKGQGEEEEEPSNAKRKDRLFHWVPPFNDDSLKILYETENRIDNIQYSENGEFIFLSETNGGEQHLFTLKSTDLKTQHTLSKHRSSDFYNNPGSLVTVREFPGGGRRRGGRRGRGGGGSAVRLSSDGQHVYFFGTQYSRNPMEEAPRPFIHKVNITTGERRLSSKAKWMSMRML